MEWLVREVFVKRIFNTVIGIVIGLIAVAGIVLFGPFLGTTLTWNNK